MFHPTDQHSDDLKNDDHDEVLYVPKEMMDYPLGFVVDAGLQITKSQIRFS